MEKDPCVWVLGCAIVPMAKRGQKGAFSANSRCCFPAPLLLTPQVGNWDAVLGPSKTAEYDFARP